ncbi:hypothetical protein B0T13DRAFT_481643 [Neurospora crassa]|nr:hypothetical protein B0T13DRAFT_481643 [Neurospora crassa]
MVNDRAGLSSAVVQQLGLLSSLGPLAATLHLTSDLFGARDSSNGQTWDLISSTAGTLGITRKIMILGGISTSHHYLS